MKTYTNTAFFISLILSISGCNIFESERNRDGKFMKDVVNLEEFNSPYNDYNSNIAQNKYGNFSIVFSSDREKRSHFNLVSFPAFVTYDNKKDKLNLSRNSNGSWVPDFNENAEASSFISKVNGDFNVLGPNFVSTYTNTIITYGDSEKFSALFYADDASGKLKIKYVSRQGRTGEISEPANFELLNDSHNSAYPSISPYGDRIYFCSDRGGNFDIYELTIPRGSSERVTMENLTKPKSFTLRKVEELSSPFEDKCPYLNGNTMVFTSNRSGGEGGFDIYYSTYTYGRWSEPVNAGQRINTKYDEYRPILPNLNNFSYYPMIFSSDRPGGQGGFDLYMTGLKEIQW